MRPDIEHKQLGPTTVRCFVLTISDTRTEVTDTGGRAIADLLAAAGHTVAGRSILKDEPDQVRAALEAQLSNADVDAIVTTGGTGITSRDTTYEVIAALLDKRLDGFGELFRMSPRSGMARTAGICCPMSARRRCARSSSTRTGNSCSM